MSNKRTRVVGQAILKVDFTVDLPIREEEFEDLSRKKQDELLTSTINWSEVMNSSEVDEFDIDEYMEVEAE